MSVEQMFSMNNILGGVINALFFWVGFYISKKRYQKGANND